MRSMGAARGGGWGGVVAMVGCVWGGGLMGGLMVFFSFLFFFRWDGRC